VTGAFRGLLRLQDWRGRGEHNNISTENKLARAQSAVSCGKTSLVEAEDESISVWAIIQRSNEILQGAASIVGQLCKQGLRLGFGEGAHCEDFRW